MEINREIAAKAAARFRNGDEAGFDQLVSGLYTPIFRYFLSSLRDPEDARELSQEVFFRVYRGIAGFSGGSVSAWVFRIARNLMLDFCRSSGFRKSREMLPIREEILPGGEGAADRVTRREITAVLAEAVEQLPERQREIFSLFYFHHLTVKEAAETVGCSEGVARVRLFRARKRLAADPQVAALKEAYNEMQ